MPSGDKTGPEGKGPKTGRGLGKTKGNSMGQGIGQPKKRFFRNSIGNNLLGLFSGTGRNRKKTNK